MCYYYCKFTAVLQPAKRTVNAAMPALPADNMQKYHAAPEHAYFTYQFKVRSCKRLSTQMHLIQSTYHTCTFCVTSVKTEARALRIGDYVL